MSRGYANGVSVVELHLWSLMFLGEFTVMAKCHLVMPHSFI
jgi:hypothetical protein